MLYSCCGDLARYSCADTFWGTDLIYLNAYKACRSTTGVRDALSSNSSHARECFSLLQTTEESCSCPRLQLFSLNLTALLEQLAETSAMQVKQVIHWTDKTGAEVTPTYNILFITTDQYYVRGYLPLQNTSIASDSAKWIFKSNVCHLPRMGLIQVCFSWQKQAPRKEVGGYSETRQNYSFLLTCLISSDAHET